MKLKSIMLENFRQFYGKQKIEFEDNDKNVTVIFGENGKGKTGIFRALIFGLFGETHLSQDNKKEKIHLVNLLQLEQKPAAPIKAVTSIEFSHKNKTYLIERSVIGYKLGKTIEERINDPKLFITDENFVTKTILEKDEIVAEINAIIDPKIKDFFLFDAEKIEMLSKTDAIVKSEVKTGIIKLLQIDVLDKGIDILRNLYNFENKAIVEKSSNINLKQKETEIELIKSDINAILEKVQLKEKRLEECKEKINECEVELLKNSEIKKIQEKIENLNNTKNIKSQLLGNQIKNLREVHFNNGHMILANDFYIQIKNYLSQSINEQKDLVPLSVIEKSLKEMFCECCMTELKEGNEPYKNILKLKANFERSETTIFVSELLGSIEEYFKEKDEVVKKIKSSLSDIKETKNELREIEKEIDRYKNEIKDYSNSFINLREVEKMLEKYQADREYIEIKIRNMNLDLGMKEKNQEKAEQEYEKLLVKDSSLKFDRKKLEYIKNIKNEFEKIFSEYSSDMRQKLMEETTEIFKQLIDYKDKNLIQKIKINDKYELEALGWQGSRITQDLSQGQKQVMSLSFITALAKIAAGGNSSVDFPLFMDTPFGRISGNNRDNLIENIPKLTSQWILLLTDTEFTTSEEVKLKSTQRLGRYYKLEQMSIGHTQIKEVELNENMATRR